MNDELEVPLPETRPPGTSRSALLLAAMHDFLELERESAEAKKKEEALLAEYSELVVVPTLFAAE
jgi:hypothetical protein